MQQQTQGRLFIVIGSIGLLAALYFLISAVIPSVDTGSTDQTINTGDEGTIQNTETGDNEIDFDELLLEAQSGLEVKVLIPEFLFTSGFEDIANDIQDTLSIRTQFFTPDSIGIYKDLDTNWTYSGESMDIIMVPTDYLYKFVGQSKAIPIAEKISPYYNTEFEIITDRDEYTFVPHAIDPAIIFSQDGENPPQNINDRLNIVSNRAAPKRYHIPLVFGIGDQDRTFLKQGRESFNDNFFFFYNIIRYIIQGDSRLDEIKTLIDIPNLGQSSAWNIADFIAITKKLSERNPYCKIYPSICIFSYNFADHRFGFMSDITKSTKYFDNEDYIISPFRYRTDYPARGRGFLIRKSENKGTNIAHFLEGYIQASLIDINTALRENTIPASNIASTNLSNEDVPAIIYDNKNWKILIGDGQTAEIFTKETPILDVIAGEYNPELFLQELNREF